MNSFKITNSKAEPLTVSELNDAVQDLVKPIVYPKVNRKFIDPIKAGEHRFALFSFIKSAGATPNEDGIYGVAKIRGSFNTEQEANDRAEEIIRDVDSTNSIFTCVMGAPFPLASEGFSLKVLQVDLTSKVEKVISDNVRAKRIAEQKEMDELKERRERLMKNDVEELDAEEKYVEQRVKLAHLRYAISEHQTKLIECKELEQKVVDHLNECKSKNPEYEEQYLIRYKQGRRKANIPEDTDLTGFMRFMADPINPEPSYIS